MAAAAAAPAIHDIVKEAVDVGVRVNSLYKAFKYQSLPGVGDVQRGASRQDAEHLRGDAKAVKQAIQKAFDNQASLLALVSQGSADTCSGSLDDLQSEIDRGFDAVMQTIQDEAAIRAARELKTKSGLVTLACSRMLEDIAAATESQQRQLTPCARRDIEKTERSAAELYQWANSFVPSDLGSLTKQSKFQTIPYIVAMAYAARIQAITRILERDGMDKDCAKSACPEPAHQVVDDFIAVLTRVLEGVMADTSLLEVAMDLQLPMTMYLTFIASFRASVDELLSPGGEHRDVVVWDDGLSPIRNVLHFTPSDAGDHQEHTIELKSVAEALWWVKFTGIDLTAADVSRMRMSIQTCELCHELGARDDDHIARIALIPGQKSALMQLPPARALRTALCANIARADRPGPAPPPSFARVGAPPPPLPAPPEHLHAATPRTLSGHTGTVWSVALCAGADRMVSGSRDKSVRVWSRSSGQLLRTLSDHTDWVLCVALSPDGKRAVSGSKDKSVRVWNLESGSAKHTLLQAHSAHVRGVALSPDGRCVASGSLDKTVKLWNMHTGRNEATLTGHSDFVLCVAFSPDSLRLASGSSDKSIRVWNVPACALERSLAGHSDAVEGVAVMPDGLRLVSGSWDKTVRVWSLSSGAEEMRFEGHSGAVNCVAVFPDGERIASGGSDRSVRVWNVRRRELEMTLTEHSQWVQCVAVAPDGRGVVSGSWDKAIKAWELREGEGNGNQGRDIHRYPSHKPTSGDGEDGNQSVGAARGRVAVLEELLQDCRSEAGSGINNNKRNNNNSSNNGIVINKKTKRVVATMA